MPPINYERIPPTANDVNLEPDFITHSNKGDSDYDMILFTTGQEDAYTLAQDIERNKNGNVNLNEVRKGLSQAAEALTNLSSKDAYLKGVDSFIEHQLAPR